VWRWPQETSAIFTPCNDSTCDMATKSIPTQGDTLKVGTVPYQSWLRLRGMITVTQTAVPCLNKQTSLHASYIRAPFPSTYHTEIHRPSPT
jgi:hypothetical protein